MVETATKNRQQDDDVVIYASPQLWQATLYEWVHTTTIKERKQIIDKIIAACNKELRNIATLVDGEFCETGETAVKYRGPYVKFPGLLFNIGTLKCMAEIRINPCVSYQMKHKHYSKLWVIISANKDRLSSIAAVKEVFDQLESYAQKLENKIKDLYVAQTKILDATKKYTISANNFGISNPKDGAISKLFGSAESDAKFLLNNDITTSIIKDVLFLNFQFPIIDVVEKVKDLNWNIAKSNGTRMLYGARYEAEKATIAGITNTVDLEKMHSLFRPISIRIANML